MAGAGIEQQFAAQGADAAADADRAEAEQVEFVERIRAAEREAGAVIVDGDFEVIAAAGKRNGDARGARVLVDVVQRFADNLEDFQGDFRFRRFERFADQE